MLNIISLGAGTQSSAMALMAACGEITPMPSAAVFADTQDEPAEVYEWLEWLRAQLPYPVIVATKGNLMQATMRQARSKKTGLVWTKNLLPMYMKMPDGRTGMLPRHCTLDYKIAVVRREFRNLLGVRSVRANSGVLINCWIGISTDEAHRVKDSQVAWINNHYPLIDAGISRDDCVRWIQQKFGRTPPKSACKRCPYQDDSLWLRRTPVEIAELAEWERKYQSLVASDGVTRGVPYLHESLVPIDKVKFDPETRRHDKFGNECDGMCGV